LQRAIAPVYDRAQALRSDDHYRHDIGAVKKRRPGERGGFAVGMLLMSMVWRVIARVLSMSASWRPSAVALATVTTTGPRMSQRSNVISTMPAAIGSLISMSLMARKAKHRSSALTGLGVIASDEIDVASSATTLYGGSGKSRSAEAQWRYGRNEVMPAVSDCGRR
jgi:hypothetical protein